MRHGLQTINPCTYYFNSIWYPASKRVKTGHWELKTPHNPLIRNDFFRFFASQFLIKNFQAFDQNGVLPQDFLYFLGKSGGLGLLPLYGTGKILFFTKLTQIFFTRMSTSSFQRALIGNSLKPIGRT
jgi:hypothetical protein